MRIQEIVTCRGCRDQVCVTVKIGDRFIGQSNIVEMSARQRPNECPCGPDVRAENERRAERQVRNS